MPKGKQGFQKGHLQLNTGRTHFKKGITPWNKGKKGCMPWNKGKHPEYVQGKNHPMWKGGRYISTAGYIYVLKPNHPYRDKMGYVRGHRLIMEKVIGRYLYTWEVVHHINKIKDDNRIENLKLFSNNGKHIKEHYNKKKE